MLLLMGATASCIAATDDVDDDAAAYVVMVSFAYKKHIGDKIFVPYKRCFS